MGEGSSPTPPEPFSPRGTACLGGGLLRPGSSRSPCPAPKRVWREGGSPLLQLHQNRCHREACVAFQEWRLRCFCGQRVHVCGKGTIPGPSSGSAATCSQWLARLQPRAPVFRARAASWRGLLGSGGSQLTSQAATYSLPVIASVPIKQRLLLQIKRFLTGAHGKPRA